jgi:acyl-CoA thioesterase-1
MRFAFRAPAKAVALAFALAFALVLAVASPVAAATLNIVAIGASNTTGFGVGSDRAYPALLQALLRKKGINANVTNAGVNGDVTSGMLSRLDSAVPKGTDLVILQPGGNDLRFFGTRERRAANLAAMVARLRARHIRVIVYDPDPVPPDFYQWDHIHFNAAAHAKIAATLAAQISAQVAAKPAAQPEVRTAAPANSSLPAPAAGAPQAAAPGQP